MKRREEGFTLIELGIVIAVIAILATVVLFGRGFITSSRLGKLNEAAETVRKGAAVYAGVLGGTVRTSTANEIPTLGSRQLLPVTAAPWNVGTGMTIDQIRFDNVANQNLVLIQYTVDTMEHAQDVWKNFGNDATYLAAGTTVGGLVCTGATMPTTAGPVNACFRI